MVDAVDVSNVVGDRWWIRIHSGTQQCGLAQVTLAAHVKASERGWREIAASNSYPRHLLA